MSASPMARQAVESSTAIPIKRVLFNDLSELPAHYSSTPGGTLFSTTPGGSKIVYEKSVLLNLRNSPISKTPPNFEIPQNIMCGGNKKTNHSAKTGLSNGIRRSSKPEITHAHEAEDQFEMDL